MNAINYHLWTRLGMLWVAFASFVAGDPKLPDPEHRQELVGTVTKVLDGDSFWLDHGDATTKIRLRFVDAPENDQPYGDKAKAFTEKFVKGKLVTCYPFGKSFDRVLATCYVEDVSLIEELTKNGLGWIDQRYTKNKQLLAMQQEAIKKRVGLWSQSAPKPPWEWRKRNKK